MHFIYCGCRQPGVWGQCRCYRSSCFLFCSDCPSCGQGHRQCQCDRHGFSGRLWLWLSKRLRHGHRLRSRTSHCLGLCLGFQWLP
ncbi:hypothetical protein HaLaN_15751, partial [Haematococcus lacustris]